MTCPSLFRNSLSGLPVRSSLSIVGTGFISLGSRVRVPPSLLSKTLVLQGFSSFNAATITQRSVAFLLMRPGEFLRGVNRPKARLVTRPARLFSARRCASRFPPRRVESCWFSEKNCLRTNFGQFKRLIADVQFPPHRRRIACSDRGMNHGKVSERDPYSSYSANLGSFQSSLITSSTAGYASRGSKSGRSFLICSKTSALRTTQSRRRLIQYCRRASMSRP